MNSKAVIRKLRKEGWILVGGKGDHEKFKHPDKSGHVVVPHPRKDRPVGTGRRNETGWSRYLPAAEEPPAERLLASDRRKAVAFPGEPRQR